MSKNELRYLLALQRVPNLGTISAKKLLRKVGSAEGVFKEKKKNLLKIDGIGLFKLKNLSVKQQLAEADQELLFIEQNSITYCSFLDKNYPEHLKHCEDGPILFFQQGNINLQHKKIISIVGTRNITSYGRTFCTKLIEDLAPLNPIIVSGFAYGIDITAHKAAMDNNLQTIACLAHGFNQIYPKIHKKYMNKVNENGGFITEFWSSDSFDRNNFLKRNRIIAGISQATIIIESAQKGGSLVTADIANSYNKDVFAVPGRVTDTQSQGCNNLIKTQQAHLLNSAADLIYLLGWELEEKKPKPQQTELFVELTEDEKVVYHFLKDKEKQLMDIIAIECKIPTFKLASILLSMELKGVIKPLPGKLFEII
ncbi:MAG: DNA-processing protein DprA [Flavobacteriales bacterium]